MVQAHRTYTKHTSTERARCVGCRFCAHLGRTCNWLHSTCTWLHAFSNWLAPSCNWLHSSCNWLASSCNCVQQYQFVTGVKTTGQRGSQRESRRASLKSMLLSVPYRVYNILLYYNCFICQQEFPKSATYLGEPRTSSSTSTVLFQAARRRFVVARTKR